MVQIDTKHITLIGGIKIYQFTAIDALTKAGFWNTIHHWHQRMVLLSCVTALLNFLSSSETCRLTMVLNSFCTLMLCAPNWICVTTSFIPENRKKTPTLKTHTCLTKTSFTFKGMWVALSRQREKNWRVGAYLELRPTTRSAGVSDARRIFKQIQGRSVANKSRYRFTSLGGYYLSEPGHGWTRISW